MLYLKTKINVNSKNNYYSELNNGLREVIVNPERHAESGLFKTCIYMFGVPTTI